MKPHLSVWSWYWLAWILAFLIPELWWVFHRPLYTLSDTVWGAEKLDMAHPFDFGHWTPVHWGIFVLVFLLFAWLTLHLPFGLLR